jgi:release factor glutamine methyltransferase
MHPRDAASVAVELSPATPRAKARAGLAAVFAHAGLDTPDLDARLLVLAACGIDHAGLIRDPDAPLGTAADLLTKLATERLRRTPVSRLLGRREFWGLDLAISADVLDPRPETEGVVGAVLDAIGGRRADPLRILDLGTGSGAILCALLHELPGAFGLGVDRSAAACRVARGNLFALGLAPRGSVVCGSWDEALRACFDIVVSNPPYIPRGDLAGLAPEVRDHDPVAALDGGADGLGPYRLLAPRLADLLQPGGVAAFECGRDQGPAVAELLGRTLSDVRVLRDLAGCDRVVVGNHAPVARRHGASAAT